jgi:profilin
MSGWAAYTTALVNTKNVSVAAIVGLDGTTWANSDAKALPITAAEAKALVAAYKDATPLRTGGMHVGGVRYIALGCDDNILQGKKGTGGVIVAKSNKTIVVGMYTAESGIQAGPANDAVIKLREDLKKKTF